MSFKQVFGGVLVGVAFGMQIGLALAASNYGDTTKCAGVGVILTIIGAALAWRGSRK
jgi:hypothetical protein